MPTDLVYLVDIDNTLLDNDAVVADLRRHLPAALGVSGEQRYWEIFEELWQELGYADYLGAFQRFRVERPRDQQAIRAAQFLLALPVRRSRVPRRRRRPRRAAAPRGGGDSVRWRCRRPAGQGRRARGCRTRSAAKS